MQITYCAIVTKTDTISDTLQILSESVRNGRKTVTTVSCLLEKCIYNKDAICTKDTITLSDDHYCIGGCDDGWEFPPEEEDEEE